MNEWGKYLFSKPGSVASGFEEPSGEHVVFFSTALYLYIRQQPELNCFSRIIT